MNKCKIGVKTVLNDSEQEIVREIAKNRTANNRKNGIKNPKRCKESEAEVELHSFGAEVAFCKLFNVYPDFDVSVRSSVKGEDGGDAIVDEIVVDVKQTKYDNGRLIVLPWKAKNTSHIHCYCLMTGEFPEYTFRGFIESLEILKEERIGNLGCGETYIASQNELKEFEDLEINIVTEEKKSEEPIELEESSKEVISFSSDTLSMVRNIKKQA